MKKDRVGESYVTNEGYSIKILEVINNKNCTIKFEDGRIYTNIRYEHISSGSVKNPYHLSIYGIGFIGLGKYKAKENKSMTKMYSVWHSMMFRCYSLVNESYRPTYKDCSVHPDWHNFQVFVEWFEKNYIEGFVLDKDILLKGNKLYSPETCCFVPPEVNSIIIRRQNNRGSLPLGVTAHYNKYQSYVNINKERVILGTFKTPEKAFKVYKRAKEKEIRDIAIVCKSLIKEKVYQALVNYKIEITD